MKKLLLAVVLFAGPLWTPASAKAEDVELNFGGFTVPIPFRTVNITEMYSFRSGRGFTGAETTLIRRGDAELNFGGATAPQTNIAFPYVALEAKLPPILFAAASPNVLFGVWAGRDFDVNRNYYGVNTSLKFGKVKGE